MASGGGGGGGGGKSEATSKIVGNNLISPHATHSLRSCRLASLPPTPIAGHSTRPQFPPISTHLTHLPPLLHPLSLHPYALFALLHSPILYLPYLTPKIPKFCTRYNTRSVLVPLTTSSSPHTPSSTLSSLQSPPHTFTLNLY